MPKPHPKPPKRRPAGPHRRRRVPPQSGTGARIEIRRTIALDLSDESTMLGLVRVLSPTVPHEQVTPLSKECCP